MAINLPCTACERGDHKKCFAESMEESKVIENAGFHCSCSNSQHTEPYRVRGYKPYK